MKEYMLRKFLELEEKMKMVGISIKKNKKRRRKSKSIIPVECLISVKATIPERNREIEKIIYYNQRE